MKTIFYPLTVLLLFALAPAASAQVSWSADFRLRADADQRSGTGVVETADTRGRLRLRARLGVDGQPPIDPLTFGVRLATNVGTPGNSPHQDFSANIGGTGHVIALDRAFIKWSQKNYTVIAGKQGWPNWGQTEILFDTDIQPDGVQGKYERELGTVSVFTNFGYYFIASNGWVDNLFANDAFTTWQVRSNGRFGRLTPTVAVTGMHVRDLSGLSNRVTQLDDNTITHGFAGVDHYMVSGQLITDLTPIALLVGFDYLTSNAEAPTISDIDTVGYVAQVRVGFRSVGVRYYYYDVGEAAVPFFGDANFTQDNFPNSRGGGLTGFTGHRLQFDAAIADNVSADLRAYFQEGKSTNQLAFSETPDRAITRIQINVNVKAK